jgi:anti-sigma factor RsiW
MDRETVIEMILDPGRRPMQGTAEQRAFLAYLETSPECRAMYEQQQAVWEALELWEPAEPSAGFDRALYATIERGEANRPAGVWGWLGRPAEWLGGLRPSLAAGLAALLLLAGAIVDYQPQRGEGSVASQRSPLVETEYVEQIDQALDDIEMLVDFEALVLEPESPGRS